MKIYKKLALFSSIALLGLTLGACASNNEGNNNPDIVDPNNPDNPNPENPDTPDPENPENPDPENLDEPTEDPFEDMWKDNIFENDPDRRPNREPFVDETPLDMGEKKPYRFEFENANFFGTTNNTDHVCLGKAFAFSPSASGNIIMRNIQGKSTLSFVLESDKTCKSDLEINVATSYSGDSLGAGLIVTNNDLPYIDCTTTNRTEAVGAEGLGNGYFQMFSWKTTISLQKGTNRIKFRATRGLFPNCDYMQINTSANLIDRTGSPNWGSIQDQTTFLKYPTLEETGKLSFGCNKTPDCPFHGDYVLPRLDHKIYEKKMDEKENERYALKLSDQYIFVDPTPAVKHTLTLVDGTFKDGSTSKAVGEGTTPEILPNIKEGYRFAGWVNADDETEKFGTTFVMPTHDIKIKATYELSTGAHTVTLKDGVKFKDGTTSKLLNEGDKLPITVEVPSDKRLIGFYEEGNKLNWFNENVFVMPNRSIDIKPCFDLLEDNYAPKTGETGGKFRLFPFGGYAEFGPNCPEGCIRRVDGTGEEIAKPYYGPVANEAGAVFQYRNKNHEENLKPGFYFTPISPYKISKDKKYKFTYTIENFGNENVTLRTYHANSSGNPKPSDTVSKDVTINAGTIGNTVVEFTNLSNGNCMTTVELLNEVKELKLGIYIYITIVE